MSNGTDLRVSRSLDLLNRLERTASEFATREEQLTQELRTSRYKANRKHSVAMQEVESRLDAIVNKLDERYGAEAQRIQALYQKRKDSVLKGQTLGIRNLPRKVENARGRWLGVLQMKRLRLEKEFGMGKQTAKNNFAETSKKLADQKTHLAELESFTRHGFRGYGSFTSLLKPFSANETARTTGDLEGELKAAEARLMEFQKFGLPKLFSSLPRFILIALILLGAATLAYFMGFGTTAFAVAGGLAGLLIISVVTLHAKGGRTALSAAQALAEILQKAKASHQAAVAEAEAEHAQQRQSLQEHFDRESANLQAQWDQTDDVETKFASAARQKLEAQIPRLLTKIEQASAKRLTALDDLHRAEIQKFRIEAEAQLETIKAAQDAEMKVVTTAEEAQWQVVEEEWKRRMVPVYQGVDAMNAATAERFPDWQPAMGANWTPPTEFTAATKFAHLDLDLNASAELAPKDPKLALPGPAKVSIPLCLTFPHQGSLLFETNEPADATVGGIFNNIILRLLTTTPPGKLSFTIIDPVGLGTNFAGLMHLSDYEDSLISRRIWTQRDQIEERLEELSEHIEKVIQMYLRNEYATITEYNEQAGSVAEKYYFLVIADFPANFSETAAKKLQSIATSGPRCGIYTLIHWDQRHTLPDGCVADDLRQNSVSIHREKNEFFIHEDNRTTLSKLRFDQPPSAELALSLIHKIGKSSVDSNRVQVPFSQIAPKPGEEWTNETTNELRIAVGRTGATKLQYLAIGKGTKQHALFAGKTGSGKSTLFHVIITNLALTCSPDEVEFYLIDFKKGVEFKCYATKHLPHAKVVAIESDREFALSVLQRVDAELKRRGDMFRKLGVQDVAGYKRAGGTEPMPRSLLLIDEFQEFFVEDDTIAQSASLLFDRIVRQGRAFGIHVLLGSQTLGGAYSLARATLGQMVIRVALQCNEADAYLIMDENNSAPRLLSRPGEGIYNDSAGALEGNSPFQVVWLPDDERDQCLDKVHEIAAKSGRKYSNPIVFEGNAPAEIRENELLRQTLATKSAKSPVSAKAWLGAPNSIKGPTEAAFSRQSGNHLLIVGQRDEAAVSMLGVSIVSLAAQYPEGKARFVVLQGSPQGSPDADFLDSILAAVKQPVTVARGQEIAEAICELSAELKARTSGEVDTSTAPSIFLIIHGLHKFKKLRQEDDFSFSMDDSSENTGSQFTALISEGSSLGIHILTTVDSFNNVNRSMNRKALSEFEMRVVFQMSANDSASLIDSPKASTLGLHRALFYNEHDGTLETFRPYATPDAEWIREAAAQR